MKEKPFFEVGIGFLINQNCMNGTKSIATNNDIPRIRDIDHGKLKRKSCIIPGMTIRNGKNVILMARVAENMDLKKCVAL